MSADEEQKEQIRELKHDRGAVPLITSCGPAGVEEHIYSLVQSTVLACVDSLRVSGVGLHPGWCLLDLIPDLESLGRTSSVCVLCNILISLLTNTDTCCNHVRQFEILIVS